MLLVTWLQGLQIPTPICVFLGTSIELCVDLFFFFLLLGTFKVLLLFSPLEFKFIYRDAWNPAVSESAGEESINSALLNRAVFIRFAMTVDRTFLAPCITFDWHFVACSSIILFDRPDSWQPTYSILTYWYQSFIVRLFGKCQERLDEWKWMRLGLGKPTVWPHR